MIWNTLLLALREIRRNLLRSFLTVLGIVIGVSAVITMVTLGNGATRAISDQISAMGSNLLIVRPGQRLGPRSDTAGAAPFKLELVETVRSQLSSVQAVAPTVFKTVTVVVGNKNWSTTVTGTTNDYFVAGNWTLADGREFTPTELRAGRAVCLVGDTIRRELFGGGNPVGDRVRINQFTCDVIGVLNAKGQSAFGSDQDDTIVMPLRTAQRRLTGSTDVRRMMVSVKDGVSTDRAKGQLEVLLRELRRIGDGEDDDFNVLDTKQIAQTLSSTTQVMTTLLGAVAAVSLLVGGIGIMNIMLVSVTERTREIGIRLAIGAMEKEVLLQFLIEAVVLACLGGLTGVVLATAASIGLSSLMNIPYLFDPGINLISFGFSALIGVVFGFFPARRAARLDPIDALRHE